MKNYETLSISLNEHIATVKLNRPAQANAINAQMISDLKNVFKELSNTTEVRVIILSAEGKYFCAGVDLNFLKEIIQKYLGNEGRQREAFREFLLDFQSAFNAIENCQKPVIAAIHGACVGGGLEMIAACDMRFCITGAFFSIKEVDVGLVADLGALQRLPHLISRGRLNELAYTGKNISGTEAEKINLVNQCFEDKDKMENYILNLANEIASKSPLVIRGLKQNLIYSRDHSVMDGLDYAATWNAAMISINDISEIQAAAKEKRTTKFKD